MAYKIKKVCKDRERRDFSRIHNSLELKDLLEIQKKSYQWFIEEGIKEVLDEMLTIFNDETGLGKLYISYPMIEAIRDFSNEHCVPFTQKCLWEIEELGKYKNLSGNNNLNAQLGRYNIEDWRGLIAFFAMRVGCLFDRNQIPDYMYFRYNVTPETIYAKQKEKYIKDGKIFVLSAIPEFLLDYHKETFWRGHIRNRKKLKPVRATNGKCQEK